MNVLKIALLQIAPTGSIEGNLNKGIEFVKKAKEQNADIVLFPEMYSNGYNFKEGFKDEAISLDSFFLNSFKSLAKELKIAIGITFLEKTNSLPLNSFCLFDYNGELVLHYSKVHTCDFGDEIKINKGTSFNVAKLNTRKGYVMVGAMICYDREFPESARILMLKGAELILVPNACPMEINRISQLRARAYENMLAVATTNYPSTVPDCNGHSTIFDGIAYKEGIIGSRDTNILELGEGEEMAVASITIDELRKYREEEVHGNAYRRPLLYKELIKEEKKYPFIRKDYRND